MRNAEKMLDEELRPTLDRLRARSRDSAGASAFMFQSSTLKSQILKKCVCSIAAVTCLADAPEHASKADAPEHTSLADASEHFRALELVPQDSAPNDRCAEGNSQIFKFHNEFTIVPN